LECSWQATESAWFEHPPLLQDETSTKALLP